MPDGNKLEREQAILRMAIVSTIVTYTLFIRSRGGIPAESFGMVTVYAYISMLLAILLLILVWQELLNKTARRCTGMVLDMAGITVAMYYLAQYGAPLFAAYLFVTIGYGFRYGIKYLVASALLAILCFVGLSSVSVFGKNLEFIVVAGVVVLAIVPAYVAVLLRRLILEKERAEIANKEKTRFLANVSHEIRTPLNAVVGFSSMLGRETDEAKRAQAARNIKDASESLTALVDGVLDFSKIESGHVQIKQEAFDLYALVRSIEGMFSMQVEQGGVRYITDIDDSVPPCIKGDVGRLRQILVNLAGNAVKFTTAGEIRVRIRRTGGHESSEQLLFEVIDTGIGIPKALQARIFERFRQADDSVQRKYGGTGLGTAIAKRLVELMDGTIGVDSQEQKGSRFWFQIPLSEASMEKHAAYSPDSLQPSFCIISGMPGNQFSGNSGMQTDVATDARAFKDWNALEDSGIGLDDCFVIVDSRGMSEKDVSGLLGNSRRASACLIAYDPDNSRRDEYLRSGFHMVIRSFEHIDNVRLYAAQILDMHSKSRLKEDLSRYLEDGDKPRVLVTDDCKLNRHVMKSILDEIGVESDFASSGPMALDKLSRSAYDLMVLDIQMPGMSGFDVIESYHSQSRGEDAVPIMIVTGDATSEIYDECNRLGVSRFLLKPVDPDKLRYALASLVDVGRNQPDAGLA
jgi:two-component system sensor histidine kinase RpfC